jgi:hypothetical protein
LCANRHPRSRPADRLRALALVSRSHDAGSHRERRGGDRGTGTCLTRAIQRIYLFQGVSTRCAPCHRVVRITFLTHVTQPSPTSLKCEGASWRAHASVACALGWEGKGVSLCLTCVSHADGSVADACAALWPRVTRGAQTRKGEEQEEMLLSFSGCSLREASSVCTLSRHTHALSHAHVSIAGVRQGRQDSGVLHALPGQVPKASGGQDRLCPAQGVS